MELAYDVTRVDGGDEDLGYSPFGGTEPTDRPWAEEEGDEHGRDQGCDEGANRWSEATDEDAGPAELIDVQLHYELVRQLHYARSELEVCEQQREQHEAQMRYLRDALVAKDALNNRLSAKLEGLQHALGLRLELMNGVLGNASRGRATAHAPPGAPVTLSVHVPLAFAAEPAEAEPAPSTPIEPPPSSQPRTDREDRVEEGTRQHTPETRQHTPRQSSPGTKLGVVTRFDARRKPAAAAVPCGLLSGGLELSPTQTAPGGPTELAGSQTADAEGGGLPAQPTTLSRTPPRRATPCANCAARPAAGVEPSCAASILASCPALPTAAHFAPFAAKLAQAMREASQAEAASEAAKVLRSRHSASRPLQLQPVKSQSAEPTQDGWHPGRWPRLPRAMARNYCFYRLF
ncbi:hypothetical protein T492DRAFT_1057682 [Pavlovales sp. CCMP2436]|nr:hypothetical protein T492DRAFT_1057682 [Pavlovales sp. CCMP2436]